MITEQDVRRVALSLPATSEKPSYGQPGFVDELTELLTDSWYQRAPKRLADELDATFGEGGRPA